MAEVEFRSIRKQYGDAVIVEDLNLTLPDGSFTVLVGPSGCGKSTTLRMLAGLESVTAGQVLIDGKDVTKLEPRDRDVAMVFQNYALYPHLSVAENIGFPLKATKQYTKAEITKRVGEAAEVLGLADYLKRKPGELSGGQQQRVAIGRAIVRKPKVFLFDEPLSNLDAKLRVETRSELLQIQRELGITSLYVTHDQEEAMTMSDRMIVMNSGKIVQAGVPAEVYGQPASAFVAGFVGSPKMNVRRGKVIAGQFSTQEKDLTMQVPSVPDGEYLVGVRPDDIGIAPGTSGGNKLHVEVVELLGPRAIVTLEAASGVQMKAVVDASLLADFAVGDFVSLDIKPESVHVFDANTELRV